MMSSRRICVDPGHGGVDPGADSHGVLEKTLALQYGLSLSSLLKAVGAAVIVTRTQDILPGFLTNKDAALMERCNIANNFKAECFVSLHFNASDNPSARGLQVFYAKGSTKGQALANAVYEATTCDKLHTGVHSDQTPEDGNRRLAVLRYTKMPAILIEFGFITNDRDRVDAQDGVKRAAVLNNVVLGIDTWLKTVPLVG